MRSVVQRLPGRDRERPPESPGRSHGSRLDRCTVALQDDGAIKPFDKLRVNQVVEEMGSKGLRVLAFARRSAPSDLQSLDHHHVTENLIFLGLQGMIDPPRPEVIAAVQKCRQAGVAVKMITGDHVLTGSAVARQIGWDSGQDAAHFAVSGRDLERLTDDELRETAERTVVFARVAPEQKLRLVEALQARGHVVAMTGDGVNDAPALKQANIGIATMMAVQLLFTYLPVMNRVFHTAPLSGQSWLRILAAGAIVFAVVEIEKLTITATD